MTLIAQNSQIAADKPIARLLLSNLQFLRGKRYADFNSSTDKVAEFGLAALIAGVAAKSLADHQDEVKKLLNKVDQKCIL